MALTASALKKIAGAGDQNLFIYKSTDAPATVAGSGYFNNSTDDLKQFEDLLVTFDHDFFEWLKAWPH